MLDNLNEKNAEKTSILTSPLKAIRAKCIDCCCGSKHEVKMCTAKNCPLWLFRMGHKPKK